MSESLEWVKSEPGRSESTTRSRVLESAIRQFAERGFDEVSVRDIAEAAGANPAAISYYFGAKEQLIQQAIRAVVSPLIEQRLAALARVERTVSGPFAVEDVVRAMVEPTVYACKRNTGPERYYARILTLSFALRQPFIDEVMAEQTDALAKRFIDAFARALPSVGRDEIYWRYDFMLGSMIHILLDSSRNDRLKRISGGLCDTSAAEPIIAQLTRFVSAGMRMQQMSR